MKIEIFILRTCAHTIFKVLCCRMQRCFLVHFLVQNTLASRNIFSLKQCLGKPKRRIQYWPQCMNFPKIVHSANRSSFKHPVLTCLYGNWNAVIAFTSYQNVQLLQKGFYDLQILYYFLLCSLWLFSNFLANFCFQSSFQTNLKGCSAFDNLDFSNDYQIHLFYSFTIIFFRWIAASTFSFLTDW
jgi:hypothetical protein